MNMSYKYAPLRRERQEIRLLQISISQTTETLSCHIVHCSLLSAPIYEALSYTWKESSNCDQLFNATQNTQGIRRLIEIDGRTMKVFENLYSAMSTLASSTTGFLWIDAICIDQENMTERQHQVGLMNRIFSGAKRVRAWLGPSSTCSSSAISFLRALACSHGAMNHEALVIDITDGPDSMDNWISLLRLVERDWWKRVWVIQEYVLGRDVMFICGKETFDARTLDRALQVLYDHWAHLFATHTLQQIGFNARVLDPLWNLIALRHRLHQNDAPSVDPLTHLSLTRGSHATDSRDRLFAQYGLMSEKVRNFCPPNYSLPEIEIFKQFFQNYVRDTGDLSILCHAGMDSKTEQAWPTWLARWTPGRHVYPFHCDWTGKQEEWPSFLACGNIMRSDFEITPENLLRCKGVIVDKVDGVQLDTWCKMPWEAPIGTQSTSDKCAYEGSEGTFEALWRTIVADTNRNFFTGNAVLCDPERAPHKFGALFAAKCKEYDRGNCTKDDTGGAMPESSPPGCTNIERRWHGMRELKLGGTRLQDVIPKSISSAPGNGLSGNDLQAPSRDWDNFEGSFGQVFYRRRLFTTTQGRLGVATRSLKPGDKVCIIWGCPIPLLLRYSQVNFELVGDAYIHGIMEGEALINLSEESPGYATFDIS